MLCLMINRRNSVSVRVLLELKAEIVGDERDKFRVHRLAARGMYGVAEYSRENVNVASVPAISIAWRIALSTHEDVV